MKYSTDLQSNKQNIHSDFILVRVKGDTVGIANCGRGLERDFINL